MRAAESLAARYPPIGQNDGSPHRRNIVLSVTLTSGRCLQLTGSEQ